MKQEIVLCFDAQGIVLRAEEIQSITPQKSTKGINRMIDAAYMNRKLLQFFYFPSIDDLEEDKEILPVVWNAVKEADNPIRKTLRKVYPEMTMNEIVKVFEEIYVSSKSIKRNKWVMTIFYGLILFIITHIIHKLITKDEDI